MHRYRDLKFWSESKELCVAIYQMTQGFPSEERFGITDQMRRASVSIPSNIAEGSSRVSNKDFKRFIDYSMGSAYELETQLEIARELRYMDESDFEELSKKITSVIKQMSKFRSNCLS